MEKTSVETPPASPRRDGARDGGTAISLESLLGDGYTMASRTHHVVYRSRDGGLFLKTTRHRDPISRDALWREKVANELLARSATWGTLSDEQHLSHPYLLTLSRGITPGAWSADLIAHAGEHLESMPLLANPVHALPEGDEWPRLLLSAIKNRGSSVDISAALEADYSSLRGNCLVHRDPHLGNWVLDDRSGVLSLIDWEAGIRGSLDVMRALIAYNVVLLEGRSGARKALRPLLRGVESGEGARATLELKGLSGAAWAEWAGLGKPAMDARIKAAKDAISLL